MTDLISRQDAIALLATIDTADYTPEDVVMLCIEALTNMPSAKSRWELIETAPKDGTEFQTWLLNPEGVEGHEGYWEPRCRFNPDSEILEVWGRIDYDLDGWENIHSWLVVAGWMPLPEPPK